MKIALRREGWTMWMVMLLLENFETLSENIEWNMYSPLFLHIPSFSLVYHPFCVDARASKVLELPSEATKTTRASILEVFNVCRKHRWIPDRAVGCVARHTQYGSRRSRPVDKGTSVCEYNTLRKLRHDWVGQFVGTATPNVSAPIWRVRNVSRSNQCFPSYMFRRRSYWRGQASSPDWDTHRSV